MLGQAHPQQQEGHETGQRDYHLCTITETVWEGLDVLELENCAVWPIPKNLSTLVSQEATGPLQCTGLHFAH